MKPAPSTAFQSRRNERGVALIIVLGFLGLMVMMAVAFMVQARVERMVADSTLEGMRARQVAQTGIAAAIQDYMNYIKGLGNDQTKAMTNLFLSGDLNVSASYHYSDIFYDSTNLWNGEAADWLPDTFTSKDSSVNIDNIKDMEWIWVRQKPNTRSRILGRYAYACFNLSGGVDANLLGRAFGQEIPGNGYGAQTNRNNVRKMLLNGVRAAPSTDTAPQLRLARYQSMWQGFDTPAALVKLTDGKNNDGQNSGDNRWANYDMDEKSVGPLATDHLSCYSYAATHKGEKTPLLKESDIHSLMSNESFRNMVGRMGGGQKQIDEIEMALKDYFTDKSSPTYPAGTDYPSVAAVPMFNEIMAEMKLEKSEGKCQLKVTITPEFWCPFPSEDNDDGDTYLLEAPRMGGGSSRDTSEAIWITFLSAPVGGKPSQQIKLKQVDVQPASYNVTAAQAREKPYSPGDFVYTLEFDDVPPDSEGNIPDIMLFQSRGIIFNKPWYLTRRGHNVDATPSGSQNDFTWNISPAGLMLAGGKNTGKGGLEVEDPRLNHDKNLWTATDSGTIGAENSCLQPARRRAAAKMGYDPGEYMYCRNAPMQTPAEFGYIPIYVSAPWMTLDIFSDNGVDFMNSLVCDQNVWDMLESYKVYYTNGTINPYARDQAVLNGAFFGLDIREVPNVPGKPDKSSEVCGPTDTKRISSLILKDKAPKPNRDTFDKSGPGGWARVLRADSQELPGLNKNQRVMLAHNTWGLFNDSDSLFLVFVVAQSITEAPEKVNPVGDWDEKDDMITGERWAVALCWMDTSAEGASDDLTQEMDIIMFKYLNE